MKKKSSVAAQIAAIRKEIFAKPAIRVRGPLVLPPNIGTDAQWQIRGIVTVQADACKGKVVQLAPTGISGAYSERCLVRLIPRDGGGDEAVVVVLHNRKALTAPNNDALALKARKRGLVVATDQFQAT